MLYALAATLVLSVHLAFVVFVLLGGLLALRWPRAAWFHLPAAAWGVAIEAGGWICPLTPLENALWRAAGSEGYRGDFVARLLAGWLYPGELTRSGQWVLAGMALGINLAIYGLVLWRRRDA